MPTTIKVLYAQHSPLNPSSVLDLLVGRPSTVPYREVAAITPEDLNTDETAETDRLLGYVWRTMNCVDGDPETEICVRLRVRSIMVGDRVTIERDGRPATFQCASVGWTPVEAA